MSTRQESRELALQVLFLIEFSTEDEWQTAMRRTIANLQPSRNIVDYCETLVEGIMGKHGEIDELIQSTSTHWKLSRMDNVDRNVLRIGVYELLSQEVPPKVVIHEAVELGKKFGNTNSGSFINGILDQIAKNRRLFDS